jgi:thiamine biosynthesis protein ThiS
MKILVNGEPVECGTARTVDELIQHHRLAPETTLVEHNGAALHRHEWPAQVLQENDRIEILQVAAGG